MLCPYQRWLFVFTTLLVVACRSAAAQDEGADFDPPPDDISSAIGERVGPSWSEDLGFQSLYDDALKGPYEAICGEFGGMGECEECEPKWDIGGWMEQGFTWNPDSPTDRNNGPVLFNDRANEYQMNQLYMYFDRPVTLDGCDFGFGARADFTYGTDSRFVSSQGLELHEDNTRKWTSGRFYGMAMPQLYGEVAFPVMRGASIKVGHFYADFGFERFQAPENFFYSHSYAMNFSEPFTYTGVMGTLNLPYNLFLQNGRTTLRTGLTQGWDTWSRPGGDWGFHFSSLTRNLEKNSSFQFSFHVGEEETPFILDNGFPGSEERIAYSLTYTRKFGKRLTWAIQQNGGAQLDGLLVAETATTTTRLEYAKWYGLNNYLLYEINKQWSAGVRLEWFADRDQLLIARLPIRFEPGGNIFLNNNYFNLTMGMNWKPRPFMVVRPEIRVDWSDLRGNAAVGSDPNLRAYHDATRGAQLLLSTDVIIRF